MTADRWVSTEQFWHVNVAATWPPRGSVGPPISPTMSQLLATCTLQATFRVSRTYAQRVSPYTRLGTAFHEMLERLRGYLRESVVRDIKVARRLGVELLRSKISEERQAAAHNPREANLPWPEVAIQRMEVSAAIIAGKVWSGLATWTGTESPGELDKAQFIATEEMIQSSDGLIHGRPDLVEQRGADLTIVDYKTGRLHGSTRLSAYRRQCLIYAWLWEEKYGEWPSRYLLINPISGEEIIGRVDTADALALAGEIRQQAVDIEHAGRPEDQASIGTHCLECQYRPWCEPFWVLQKDARNTTGKKNGKTRATFHGYLLESMALEQGKQSVLKIDRAGVLTSVTVQTDAHPHVDTIPFESALRVIDVVENTSDPTWFDADRWAEIFFV